MKFDFCIGNPPYQDESLGDNSTYTPQVYNKFLDASFEIADKVAMIHPARFLFNAGSTPKIWNEKMLQDEHFKILDYEEDASNVFSNTEIKGGVAISYHDKSSDFGAIGVFTKFKELNTILHKVLNSEGFKTMQDIVITRTAFRLTDRMHEDFPEVMSQLSKGHPYDMSTNIFDRIPQVFNEEQPNDADEFISILGRENNNRVCKYIKKEYVNSPKNLYFYKAFMSSANGNGMFGENLTPPVIYGPGVGATETFISIGSFENRQDAENLVNYIKTKFLRAMLNILKTTQHLTPDVWKYVPLQDFTAQSDIDWSKSIYEIDQQLYKKYGLSQEEIDFIETNVKEME